MIVALLHRARRHAVASILIVAQLCLLIAGADQPTNALADSSEVVRWQLVSHIADLSIAWLAVPPEGLASGVLFARSFDEPSSSVLQGKWVGGATLRSQDAGKTWQTVPDAPGRVVLPPGGAPAFSLTADGVYRSTDSGMTWSAVVPVSAGELLFSPAFGQDHVVFAHAGDELWRSSDAGLTWTNLDPGEGQVVVAVRLSPTFASDHMLFVGADSARPVGGFGHNPPPTDNADSLGLLVSTDAGTTWTSLSGGLQIDGSAYQQVLDIAVSPDFATDQTLYVAALGPWPAGPDSRTCGQCVGPSTAVFRSHDAGASWEVASQQSNTRAVVGGSLIASPSLVTDQTLSQSLALSGAAPSQSGCSLSVSTDAGTSWQEARDPGQGAGLCNLGILRAAGQTVLLAYERPYYLSAGRNRNLLHSVDGGTSWSMLAPPGDGLAYGFETELTQRQALLPDRVFQATQKGDLWEFGAFPPCAIQPTLGFGQVWSQHPDWQEQAGCPLGQEQAVQVEARHQDLPGQGPTDSYWTTDGAACVHIYHDFQGQLRSGGVSAASPCSGAGDEQLSGSVLPFANGQYWLFVADRPGHGLVFNSMRSDVLELNQ